MKITDVTVECYAWPKPKPISNGKYTYTKVVFNLVKVTTDEAVTGIGLGGRDRRHAARSCQQRPGRSFQGSFDRGGSVYLSPDLGKHVVAEDRRPPRHVHPHHQRHRHRDLGSHGQGSRQIGAQAAGRVYRSHTYLYRRRLLRRGQGVEGNWCRRWKITWRWERRR